MFIIKAVTDNDKSNVLAIALLKDIRRNCRNTSLWSIL